MGLSFLERQRIVYTQKLLRYLKFIILSYKNQKESVSPLRDYTSAPFGDLCFFVLICVSCVTRCYRKDMASPSLCSRLVYCSPASKSSPTSSQLRVDSTNPVLGPPRAGPLPLPRRPAPLPFPPPPLGLTSRIGAGTGSAKTDVCLGEVACGARGAVRTVGGAVRIVGLSGTERRRRRLSGTPRSLRSLLKLFMLRSLPLLSPACCAFATFCSKARST